MVLTRAGAAGPGRRSPASAGPSSSSLTSTFRPSLRPRPGGGDRSATRGGVPLIPHLALGWTTTTLMLCASRSQVADSLLRQRVARYLMMYPSLDKALANARARPHGCRSGWCWAQCVPGSGWPGFAREVWSPLHWRAWPSRPAWSMPAWCWSCGDRGCRWRCRIRTEPAGGAGGKRGDRPRARSGGGDRVARAWAVQRVGAGSKLVWCMLALPAGSRLAAPAAPVQMGRTAGPAGIGSCRQRPG